MGKHHLLFSLDVGHRFFSDGGGAAFNFILTPASERVCRQAGLLIKYTGKGFSGFYDEERIEALRLYAADPDHPLHLGMKVFSKDATFLNYTEPGIHQNESILYFDNRVVKKTKAGIRLHVQEFVSKDDFAPVDSSFVKALLTKQDRLVRPHFLINIFLGEKSHGLFDTGNRLNIKQYCLKFKARETFWRYYVLGNLTSHNPVIADLDHKTTFEFAGQAALPNNRIAQLFRSTTPLPLQETYAYRFQLREKATGTGKVLIKRLPVASPEHMTRAIIEGEERIVSDIYVNC